VIAAGCYFLPTAAYEAIARAYLELTLEDHPEPPIDLIKFIRAQDEGVLFQGLLRCRARQSQGDGCRPATALIVGSSFKGMIDLAMFRRLFPGSDPITWSPDQGDGAGKVFNGQVTRVDQVIEFLKEREAPGARVTYGTIREFLGGPSKAYVGGPNMLRHPKMVAYLEGRWVKTGGYGNTEAVLERVNEA
jgi:hypothetical protein